MANVVRFDPAGRRRPRPLLRELVGDVLRRHRRQQQRTLADVATTARVSTQYLSELERGRKEASSEVLAAVCTALKIDLADLLGEISVDLTQTQTQTPTLRLITTAPTAPARSPRRPGEAMLLAA